MSLFRPNNATQSKVLLGYYPQTSVAGAVIPVIYGMRRIPGNVIWTGDWVATPVKSGGKSGGKGSSSSKGGAGQYNYKTAIIIGLAYGPINGIRTIWQDKTAFSPSQAIETITLAGTTHTATFSGYYLDTGVGKFSSYSVTANDFGSPGSVVLSGSQASPLSKVASSPGPGQYSVDSTGHYTFNAANVGDTIQIGYVFNSLAGVSADDPLSQLSLTLFVGEKGQSPWSYTATNHPDQALGYTQLAYVANSSMPLGSSGVISNYSFEILGRLSFSGSIVDCDPSVVFVDFLTDTDFGPGFDPAWLGSMAEFSNYCLANNILVSCAFDSQQSAASHMAELLTIGNAEAVWSDAQLKVRSRGDTTAVGNGATFTPSTQPIYDLDDNDYITQPGQDPLSFSLPKVQDSYNAVKVLYSNRGVGGTNGYQETPIPAEDDYSIRLNGLREAPSITVKSICQQDMAAKVANVQLKRFVYERGDLKGVLGTHYGLLEPMDMVTVTDFHYGFDQQPFRLMTIDENENGELEFTAKIFPWSIAQPTLHPKQTNVQFVPPFYANPGNVNPPFFYELPPELSNVKVATDFILAILLSGGQNWGGCTVYISTDGPSGTYFPQLNKQTGKCQTGVLLADLAYGTNPDTTHTLSVNMTESSAVLDSNSQENYDNLITPMVVDDELIAWKDSALITGSQFDLTTLHRGIFGSNDTVHYAGVRVGVLDGNQFAVEYAPSDIGKVWWFKFTSFNGSGQKEQNIADVTAYPFTLTAPHIRIPLPWKNFGTNTSGVEPPFTKNGLAIQTQIDGNRMTILGTPPVNVFSKVVIAPMVDPFATTSSGGNLPIGLTYAVVCAIDSSGFYSPMSAIVTINAGTSGLKASFNVTLPTGTAKYAVYAGADLDHLYVNVFPTTASAGVLTISDIGNPFLVDQTYGPPDPRFDHFNIKVKKVIHSGIFVANVLSKTAHTASIGILPGMVFTLDQLAGRTFTNYSSSPTTLSNYNITSSAAADGGVSPAFALSLSGISLGDVHIGDLVVIRSLADTHTATTIGDSLFANPFYPSGMDVDSLKGKLIRIIGGTGAGQSPKLVVSNTSTVATISANTPFDPVPDGTSIFQFEEPGWTSTTPTTSIEVPTQGLLVTPIGSISLQESQGGVSFFEITAQDANNNDSDSTLDEWFDMYIPPVPASSASIVELTPDVDGNVTIDLLKGNLFILTLTAANTVVDANGNRYVNILNPINFQTAPTSVTTWALIIQEDPIGMTGGYSTIFGSAYTIGFTVSSISSPANTFCHVDFKSDTSGITTPTGCLIDQPIS